MEGFFSPDWCSLLLSVCFDLKDRKLSGDIHSPVLSPRGLIIHPVKTYSLKWKQTQVTKFFLLLLLCFCVSEEVVFLFNFPPSFFNWRSDVAKHKLREKHQAERKPARPENKNPVIPFSGHCHRICVYARPSENFCLKKKQTFLSPKTFSLFEWMEQNLLSQPR